MRALRPPSLLRRSAADLALLAAVGVVMAFLGPFETASRPLSVRFVYWLLCMVGGGALGIAIDEPVRRRLAGFWSRLLVVSVAMTPLAALWVWLVALQLFGGQPRLAVYLGLFFQVFVVSFATMAFRQLAWARMVTPLPSADPVPPSDAAFRQRLSARRRAAAIHAVEAEDHYLRVHTDAGEELVAARFMDAMEELAGVPGFRTHRSWWVAADAIDAVRWSRGRGELRIKSGLTLPVSRANASALKQAGWF